MIHRGMAKTSSSTRKAAAKKATSKTRRPAPGSGKTSASKKSSAGSAASNTASTRKASSAKKAAVVASAKKTGSKKAIGKKVTKKTTGAKKAAAKQVSTKKTGKKKALARKASTQKASPKKAVAKKASTPKRAVSAQATQTRGSTRKGASGGTSSAPAKNPRPPRRALDWTPAGTLFQSPEDVRLLVVDDEPEILEMVAVFMSSRGFHVTQANDGDQALERILTERPHVVILDVMMPGISGWEICKYVRERPELDEVRIVMATGIGPKTNEATSPLYGADAHVDKPFDLKALESEVIEIITRLERTPT